ncbi:CACNA1S [Symbiodinium natans]|uniref:CACNA1S protein n=1 Tax=Symbiodinium natans TaxID=878477 RepID=A0A812R7K9_9DINO|nr:CACNA1S [Symbiodinium natans]
MPAGERERLESVLEDAWSSFRAQVLEAFPEYHEATLMLKSDLHSVGQQGAPDPALASDEFFGRVVGPGDSDDGDGEAISRVPSLPKFDDKNGLNKGVIPADAEGVLSQEIEAMKKFATNKSDSVGSHGLGCASPSFLTSGLIGLSEAESRAIRHRLRVRLGALSTAKLVSGKTLHDAVHALGLTRYSIDDINEMVNLVADFINLRFEEVDRRTRRQTIFSWETGDEVERFGKPIWEWPSLQEYFVTVRRSASLTGFEPQAERTFNVVPASALMELFLAQDSEIHKRIFGQTGVKQFQAIREILLAGDTNRLVAELTFVRINDLAAPPEPLHPLMYVEPLVAILILANGIMIGFQTDPSFEPWEGWAYVELGFACVLLLEIALRVHFLTCRGFWLGDDRVWNWFDVVLCVTSMADVTVQFASTGPPLTDITGRELSLLRFCRLIRLVRIVKVFRLKFMKDLRLMVKGLVAGIRTLVLAFTLLVSVIYVIAGFATMSFGGITGATVEGLVLQDYFYNLPMSMFTAFRCFTGDCVSEKGLVLS